MGKAGGAVKKKPDRHGFFGQAFVHPHCTFRDLPIKDWTLGDFLTARTAACSGFSRGCGSPSASWRPPETGFVGNGPRFPRRFRHPRVRKSRKVQGLEPDPEGAAGAGRSPRRPPTATGGVPLIPICNAEEEQGSVFSPETARGPPSRVELLLRALHGSASGWQAPGGGRDGGRRSRRRPPAPRRYVELARNFRDWEG